MSEQPTSAEPATPGTGAGVIEFLDRSAERGWINPSSAQALRTATIKILSIDDDWEKIDLAELDLDEQFGRFQTLKHNDYSDGSLKNYKSRFNQAVAMYLARVRGESDWKSHGPSSRAGGSSRNGNGATSKPTVNPGGSPPRQNSPAAPVTAPVMPPPPEAAQSARSIQHRYPLRDDVDALLQLPRDLTTTEANRLAKFISTLAWDDTPNSTAAANTS